MDYNTEYMQKHNEDLNTALIFVRFCIFWFVVWLRQQSQAGLFSEANSAFVIDVQPKLQKDPGEWLKVEFSLA